jgi:hypothetical protein
MTAVELGAALATSVLAPQLLQVARDPARWSWERVAALRWLRRRELARLLGSVALAPPVHADLAELALAIDRGRPTYDQPADGSITVNR